MRTKKELREYLERELEKKQFVHLGGGVFFYFGSHLLCLNEIDFERRKQYLESYFYEQCPEDERKRKRLILENLAIGAQPWKEDPEIKSTFYPEYLPWVSVWKIENAPEDWDAFEEHKKSVLKGWECKENTITERLDKKLKRCFGIWD